MTLHFPTEPGHPYAEKTLSSTLIHQGRVITMRVDQAEQPDGKPCTREVVEHPGGIVAMPILPDGRLVFVEQWRYPMGRALLEFPAGKLDPGEQDDPLSAIQRELLEETGYTATRWTPLTHIYTAPGFCDEALFLFRAEGLEKSDAVFKAADDDEFINVHCLTPDEVWRQVQSGGIVDAKTLSLLLFYFKPV